MPHACCRITRLATECHPECRTAKLKTFKTLHPIAMSGIAKIFNKTQENLGTSQKPELEEQDRELLVDLIQHGGATLKQIIIKTNRIGQEKNVRSSLKNLEELGYIKRVTYNGDRENEIFTPSRIALQNFYSILKRK